MKILFVYSLGSIHSPSKPLETPEKINFGISYVAGLLKQNGHEPYLAVLGSTWQKESFKIIDNNIKEIEPRIICFHIISTQYPFIYNVARYIKEQYPNIILIAGGPHVSINAEEVIEGPFKAICIGEGEYPILELVQQVEEGKQLSKIANLWIRNGDQIEKNPTRPFLEKLDELPFPYRDMWYRWIKETKGARFSILLGRGCYFNCTYCCNHILRTTATGSYVRFRSPDNIIAEINSLYERFPEKNEYFLEVECFNINKDWVFELCDKLMEYNNSLPKPLIFGTNIRITQNADFKDIFNSCVKGNIKYLTVGLESGSERIRKEVLNRYYSNRDIIKMAEQARQYNLRFGFQNMIGLPSESEEDFMETVLINRICQPDWYCLNILFPYPGTKIAKYCKEIGFLNKSIDMSMERRRVVMNLPTFPANRLKKRYYLFEYDVYKGKKPLIKILARVIVGILSANYILNNIFRLIINTTVMQNVRLYFK
jgi:anaerobic magnesium-protoporphyrin IX monomethyl ester cyclase